MGKIQYIEASQEWICPETGSYKVICVGGGGGGVVGSSGGTTSFGTYLSAGGGVMTRSILGASSIGGSGGYTVNGVYGGSGAYLFGSDSSAYLASAVNNGGHIAQTGIGYGAGGGSNSNYYGKPGELKADILTLAKDDAVACTVGTGGTYTAELSYLFTAGADGVIIIEFLGTEA